MTVTRHVCCSLGWQNKSGYSVQLNNCTFNWSMEIFTSSYLTASWISIQYQFLWLGIIYLCTTLLLVITMTPCQSKCSFSAAFFSVLRQILEAWGLSSRFPELCCQEALWCAASCAAWLQAGTEPRPSRTDSHSRRWCIIPTNFWITAQQFTCLNSSVGLGTAVDFKQLFPTIDTFRR